MQDEGGAAVQKAVADLESRMSAKSLELTAATAKAAHTETELEAAEGRAMVRFSEQFSCD